VSDGPNRPAGAAGFSMSADGGRWVSCGALTFANAAAVIAAASALPLPGDGVVDLAGLAHVDSAAVAVLLGVARRAAQEGRTLRFDHVPAPITALAAVYGVDRMLGAVAGARRRAPDAAPAFDPRSNRPPMFTLTPSPLPS
jgi:phospholipid transport system transporter-binding protein